MRISCDAWCLDWCDMFDTKMVVIATTYPLTKIVSLHQHLLDNVTDTNAVSSELRPESTTLVLL